LDLFFFRHKVQFLIPPLPFSESLLTDGEFVLENFDSTLFPGLPSGIQGHDGFLATHARSAPSVLAAVQKAISTYGATSVTTVGHSLGAAIALLDAVYLPLHLPSSITFKTVGYGLPRVGNPAFANFVDSAASKVHLTHINNKKDPIPIVPGK
jgi:pimeloyl-ACP methyl ester carboxylesterase